MASLEIEIIGWFGAILLLYAYFLLNEKKVTSKNLSYQLMNVIGGAMLAANAFFNNALPSTFMNIVWIFIALWGIEKLFEGKKKQE